MTFDDIADQIYEAAFVPELWPAVLGALGGLTGSASGALMVFDEIKPVRFQATEVSHDEIERFCTSDLWRRSERIQHFQANPFTGFVSAEDYFPPGLLARDEPHINLQALGLGQQVGTIIPMPSGELVVVVLERWARDGRYDPTAIPALDRLYPHLARAGLLAARLGLERARATVAALDAIGLPAAVIRASGRVLAVNGLLQAMPTVFLSVAHGGMAITDAAANSLFRHAVAAARDEHDPVVRSIPIAAKGGQPALIVHLLPLRRAARDIFTDGDVLVAVTAVNASAIVPEPSILTGLFDLTPAEAKLAAALASGQALREAGAAMSLRFSTTRTYLDRIFRKTGTHHQSQLVALLKGAGPLRR
ncbi:helix-turn-helix transcriptional regulator [Phreatobacter stygius]|uniref:Helix-turn-helix transcriptional regulator n=1 Tax=Phreatobacter stygius TaxID=1940610 RepID=A0A4D7B1M4_9HYPH|nr:helix-turn-helix transcriptional regulator [Phreatobacter stygius]QCI67619.1 helix-turn-helix transcriptional regulator [Phreatobacter stygius]